MTGRPSRRAVLAASAAAVSLLASSCRGVQVLSMPPPPPADVRTLMAAIAGERALISAYRRAIALARTADPAAVPGLGKLLAQHVQHLAQLSRRLVVPPGSAASPATSPPAPSGGPTPPPGSLATTLAGLATAELDASKRLATELLTVPPSLAQLMASISASEATHVSALHDLERVR